MSENKTMNQMERPNTRTTLHDEFVQLGVDTGMVVLVHSSLRSLGWVCGGPVAVIQALMDVVGEEGTIVMPTQTGDNSEPKDWGNPPAPESWWPIIREEIPAFDPRLTPTRGMGRISETFRNFPRVVRSNHPTYSFAAWGKHATDIVSEQPLTAGFGSSSPLAKMYDLGALILLLGVGHESNTSLHLAEHAVEQKTMVQKGTALVENGKRVWKIYQELEYDADPFETLGKEFEENHSIRRGKIGMAQSKLIDQRSMIDFAEVWLNNQQVK